MALLASPALAQQQSAPVDTSASAAVAAKRAGLSAPAATISAQPALPGVKLVTKPRGESVAPKRAPVNGVLVLYGNERCPTNNDGDEIVICERRDAKEQYRVPKELREFAITPENESWAAKAQGTLDTGLGVDTIGSCSAVGAGGNLGCFAQQAKAARAERRAMNKAANPDQP